jgi:hypothetical protein
MNRSLNAPRWSRTECGYSLSWNNSNGNRTSLKKRGAQTIFYAFDALNWAIAAHRSTLTNYPQTRANQRNNHAPEQVDSGMGGCVGMSSASARDTPLVRSVYQAPIPPEPMVLWDRVADLHELHRLSDAQTLEEYLERTAVDRILGEPTWSNV